MKTEETVYKLALEVMNTFYEDLEVDTLSAKFSPIIKAYAKEFAKAELEKLSEIAPSIACRNLINKRIEEI